MGGLGLGWDAIQVSMKLFCFLDISLKFNGLSHISHLLLFFLRNSRCKALSDGSLIIFFALNRS